MSKIYWVTINIYKTSLWYPSCIPSIIADSSIPVEAVIFQVDPVDQNLFKGLSYHIVPSDIRRERNHNFDNVNNLRRALSVMQHEWNTRGEDLIAIIEQDVLLQKRNWARTTRALLEDGHDFVVASRQVEGCRKGWPYFCCFKGRDIDFFLSHLKFNQGKGFVYLDLEGRRPYYLNSRGYVGVSPYASRFGDHEDWGIHFTSGSGWNKDPSADIEFARFLDTVGRRSLVP